MLIVGGAKAPNLFVTSNKEGNISEIVMNEVGHQMGIIPDEIDRIHRNIEMIQNKIQDWKNDELKFKVRKKLKDVAETLLQKQKITKTEVDASGAELLKLCENEKGEVKI